MSRSALLFVIAVSLCVGFFGCSKDSSGLSGGGPIVTALVGIYFGTTYDQFNDTGPDESELDHTSYSHQLFLYSDGTYLVNYLIDGDLTDIQGAWSGDSDTLNFSPAGIGCTSIAVDYIFDGLNLTLDYDHPCDDPYLLTEFYTRIN